MNYFAVVAAALSAFVLEGIWYSPALFSKAWMAASGVNPEGPKQPRMARILGVSFVWTLLGAYVFAMFLGPAPAFGYAAATGFAVSPSGVLIDVYYRAS